VLGPVVRTGIIKRNSQGEKWLGGLDWSQIDADRILHLPAGAGEIEIDLKPFPRVVEELNRLVEIPDSGPMIIYEKSGLPYFWDGFQHIWRKTANAAGIPKSVFNTCHQNRTRVIPLDQKQAWEIATAITRPISDGEIRNEVRQEMSRDLLASEVTKAQLVQAKSRYIAAAYKKLHNRYEISLDQIVGGRPLGDSIGSDQNTWQQT
jgi:hypothetical protein